MCFTPQPRALLKVLWRWGVFATLTSKSASRHSGVQFVISHLTKWLRTRRFSEPTFGPSWASKHWKTKTVSRDCSTFPHTLIFFLLTLSSLTLPATVPAFVHKSEDWLPNFLRLHTHLGYGEHPAAIGIRMSLYAIIFDFPKSGAMNIPMHDPCANRKQLDHGTSCN